MTTTNTISLKLFNAVENTSVAGTPSLLDSQGVYVPAEASYAIKEIKSHLSALKLSGEELNKTFYKSWSTITESSRVELLIDQLFHYMSTYGTNHEGKVYIPEGTLDVPEFKKLELSFISALTKDELTEKCLGLLNSGIALKEETLVDVFTLLDHLSYVFTGNENFRNKEAQMMMFDRCEGILPESPEEFLRFAMFKSIESTLLIKSKNVLDEIKESSFDASSLFNSYDLKKLSTVFNRFKPIFLAFKSANSANASVINKLAKLSKVYHKPMVSNPLNNVTSMALSKEDTHWLDNATTYALFKAISACHTRINGQENFVYRIRNGKSWAKEAKNVNTELCFHNFDFIMDYLRTRIKGDGRSVFIPEFVTYALPTSEKLFVGNIPTGTKFHGKSLAAGIYWENSWGARDLDLSALSIGGKIGWNSDYYDYDAGLIYSGDLTDATNGAVEYLHISKNNTLTPALVMNNVYSGDEKSQYKIVVGEGEDITREYMMNPNKVMAEIKTSSVQKNTVLGMIIPEDDINSFVLLNFGAGQAHVSGNSVTSDLMTKALYEQWKNPLSLNLILGELGFNVVRKNDEKDDLTIDFNLNVDTISPTLLDDLFHKRILA